MLASLPAKGAKKEKPPAVEQSWVEKTLASMTIDDVRMFHATAIRPSDATLIEKIEHRDPDEDG